MYAGHGQFSRRQEDLNSGPDYGNQDAFDEGETVGGIAGFAMNARLWSKREGRDHGDSEYSGCGWVDPNGHRAACQWRNRLAVIQNGKAVAATAQTLASAGVGAKAAANILQQASAGNGTNVAGAAPNGSAAPTEQHHLLPRSRG